MGKPLAISGGFRLAQVMTPGSEDLPSDLKIDPKQTFRSPSGSTVVELEGWVGVRGGMWEEWRMGSGWVGGRRQLDPARSVRDAA